MRRPVLLTPGGEPNPSASSHLTRALTTLMLADAWPEGELVKLVPEVFLVKRIYRPHPKGVPVQSGPKEPAVAWKPVPPLVKERIGAARFELATS